MQRRMILAIAALAGLVVASPARATTLTPGQTSQAPNVYAPLSGTTVAGPVTVTGTGTTNGEYMNVSVVESVVRDSDTGHLDFVYRLTNNSNVGTPPQTSASIVERLAVSSFAGAATEAGYVSGSDIAPVSLDRSSHLDLGKTITFNFNGDNPVPTGQSTDVLVVKTGYDYYNFKGTVALIDGQTVTISGYQPLATPEPSTMALVGLGALGFVGYALRRRKVLGS